MCVRAARNTKASGHSGILESAKAVLEDLQSTGILEGLLLNPPVRTEMRTDPKQCLLVLIAKPKGEVQLVSGPSSASICDQTSCRDIS